MCVCVCELFSPVKPELGVIPSGQENHSGAEHLNFPGGELNVINFTEQYLFKEKTKNKEVTLQLSSSPYPVSILFYLSIRSEEVLLYFSSCFWFIPEMKNRMEINL